MWHRRNLHLIIIALSVLICELVIVLLALVLDMPWLYAALFLPILLLCLCTCGACICSGGLDDVDTLTIRPAGNVGSKRAVPSGAAAADARSAAAMEDWMLRWAIRASGGGNDDGAEDPPPSTHPSSNSASVRMEEGRVAARSVPENNGAGEGTAEEARPRLPDGTELPPPANGRKGEYTKAEVLRLAVRHGKAAVVEAIGSATDADGGRCYQPSSDLLRCFPRDGECYDEVTIRALLLDLDAGTDEWFREVRAIADSEHGPAEELIHIMFGFDGHGESMRVVRELLSEPVENRNGDAGAEEEKREEGE